MVKSIKKVVKVSPTRERRKIIIVGTEGNNKTEEIYLRSLEKKQSKYHFIFADGNDTDAVNIVNNKIKKARTEGISNRNGDFAVSIFDLDIEKSKEKLYLKAKVIADSKNVMLITSNPCFEIWFLEHFCFTTKPFASRELVGMQPGDVPVTYADSRGLEEDYGFVPKIGIREGLRHFAEWYKGYYEGKK